MKERIKTATAVYAILYFIFYWLMTMNDNNNWECKSPFDALFTISLSTLIPDKGDK
jgi:hypothetical protein